MSGPKLSDRTYADEIAEKREQAKALREQADRQNDPTLLVVAEQREEIARLAETGLRKSGSNACEVKVLEEGTESAGAGKMAAGLYDRQKGKRGIASLDLLIQTKGQQPLENHIADTDKHEQLHEKVDTNAKAKGQEKVLISHFSQTDERNIQEAIPEAAGIGGDVHHGQQGLNIIDRVGPRAAMIRLLEEGEHQEFVNRAYEKKVLKRAA